MLIKCSEKKTNYYIPVTIYGKTIFRYYDNEKILFKAYRQLKYIKSYFIVGYPVILDD